MQTNPSQRFRFRRPSMIAAIAVVALASCPLHWRTQAGTGGSLIAPPNAHPFGASLTDWLLDEQTGATIFKHVLLPAAYLTAVSGSGTVEDPLILTLHNDYTIKPGTGFSTPLLIAGYEVYPDGSMDPVPPDSWWQTYDILLDPLVLDGKTVLTNDTVDNYYVSHVFNPPLLYPSPSPDGAVGLGAVQGWQIVGLPLSVGVHRLSWAGAAMIPPDNGFFPGVDIGIVLRFSYTITVVP